MMPPLLLVAVSINVGTAVAVIFLHRGAGHPLEGVFFGISTAVWCVFYIFYFRRQWMMDKLAQTVSPDSVEALVVPQEQRREDNARWCPHSDCLGLLRRGDDGVWTDCPVCGAVYEGRPYDPL